MLDIIARLMLSAGIMIGTAYLPSLSEAVGASPAGARASTAEARACPVRTVPAIGPRALACLG
jgi:hypothetical protein